MGKLSARMAQHYVCRTTAIIVKMREHTHALAAHEEVHGALALAFAQRVVRADRDRHEDEHCEHQVVRPHELRTAGDG